MVGYMAYRRINLTLSALITCSPAPLSYPQHACYAQVLHVTADSSVLQNFLFKLSVVAVINIAIIAPA